MSLAIVHSRALAGVSAPPVTVEAHLGNGLPSFTVVGLPDAEVKEARDRVRAAIQTAGFEFPARRITVNLAPADLPKASGRFDLPIAIGILAASGQIDGRELDKLEFAGELALTGELRPVRGALAMAIAARDAGHAFILPPANADEAALAQGAAIYPAASLLAIAAHCAGSDRLARHIAQLTPQAPDYPDLSEVKGQQHAKRALEIVACGGHSLLMIGPPGTGKSMLAARLPGILPAMSEAEALESAAIQSLGSAGFDPKKFACRPYRSPHHTSSAVALVGGGSDPRPGEISLAHNGILFLDELPEFDRKVLEVLREPLESNRITISRAARQADFPAAFQLVAAMNPCPCGYLGDSRCRCTADQIARYRARLSGPLLDRIDLVIEVPALPHAQLAGPADGESSSDVQARVAQARQLQQQRQGKPNARLQGHALDRHCKPDKSGQQLLDTAVARLGLSARAYHRILRVARSIADLAGSNPISSPHVAEAIQYRRGLDPRSPT